MYYTNQCPFTAKYVPIIKNIAKEQAQNGPAPTTTYALFYNGEYVTNEILSDKKLTAFICCMDEAGLDGYLKSNLGEECLNSLIAKKCCGGEYKFTQMNLFERVVVKKICNMNRKHNNEPLVNGKEDIHSISYKNIEAFATVINKA